MMNFFIIICLIISAAGCATAPQRHPATGGEYAIPAYEFIGVKNAFIWPVSGEVISSFSDKLDKTKNKGIDISSEEGRIVRASRGGKVVFCDSKVKGLGKTVILDHGDGYQTVYAYNSEILVKVGDKVEQSDVIARVGGTGRAKRPSLHFEIRKDGKAQNPSYYLGR